MLQRGARCPTSGKRGLFWYLGQRGEADDNITRMEFGRAGQWQLMHGGDGQHGTKVPEHHDGVMLNHAASIRQRNSSANNCGKAVWLIQSSSG